MIKNVEAIVSIIENNDLFQCSELHKKLFQNFAEFECKEQLKIDIYSYIYLDSVETITKYQTGLYLFLGLNKINNEYHYYFTNVDILSDDKNIFENIYLLDLQLTFLEFKNFYENFRTKSYIYLKRANVPDEFNKQVIENIIKLASSDDKLNRIVQNKDIEIYGD
jgi:hypothetical protein